MNSDKMHKLNPLGGYARIKKHLHVAHKIATKDAAKFNALINSITDQMLYDHLRDEIRFDQNFFYSR